MQKADCDCCSSPRGCCGFSGCLVVAAAFPAVTVSAEIHAPSGSQNVSTKNTDNFLEGERRKFLEAMERLDDIGLSPSAIVHTLTARGQKPDAAAEAETSSSRETGGQDNAARGEIPDAAGGQESGFSRKAGDAGSSISEKVGDAGSSIARKAGDASEKLVEQAGIAGSQMIEQAGGAVQEQTQKIVDDAKKSLKDRLKELISSMIDKL